jgi:hypothetical protein
MPRGIGRLPFIKRRGAVADRSSSDPPAIDAEAVFEDAPVGPPVLLPAMIYRQVLIDQTEVTPVWARPRPRDESEPVGAPSVADAPVEPETAAQQRRRKGSATSGEPKAPAAPRSPRKPSGNSRRRRG